MKTTKQIALLAAIALLPTLGFAQSQVTPPTPPVPAVPPVPPAPPAPPAPADSRERDRAPRVPVTYLGVETSELPSVVADQLGLAKGFGLVVDYVVPDGPAAAAGVQQNDILKMLNDQILLAPGQLSKLVRSMPEGTSITLTVLRKGAETKLTVKLAKREVPQRHGMFPDMERHLRRGDLGQLGEEMKNLHIDLGDMNLDGLMAEIGSSTRDSVREAQRAAHEAARDAARDGREAAREAREAAREAAREFRVTRQDDGSVRTTNIDMNRAEIVYHDAAGELKIGNVAGKRVLTAKDPQGKTVFSGPVETKEELDRLPADVRQRFDQLEQKDLPALPPPNVTKKDSAPAESDASVSDDDDSDDESDGASMSEVSDRPTSRPSVPFRRVGYRTTLI